MARIGDCDQVCGQIAAVDRGYILRFERSQVARVIPVVEVAAKSLQALHGRQCCFQALDAFQRSDPAEVASADGAQQIQAHIRRRSTMCHDRLRILLKVIRRQHVIGGADERFEVSPGATRDQAQPQTVGGGGRQATGDRRRFADPSRDRGRRGPQHHERQRHPDCFEPSESQSAATALSAASTLALMRR